MRLITHDDLKVANASDIWWTVIKCNELCSQIEIWDYWHKNVAVVSSFIKQQTGFRLLSQLQGYADKHCPASKSTTWCLLPNLSPLTSWSPSTAWLVHLHIVASWNQCCAVITSLTPGLLLTQTEGGRQTYLTQTHAGLQEGARHRRSQLSHCLLAMAV